MTNLTVANRIPYMCANPNGYNFFIKYNLQIRKIKTQTKLFFIDYIYWYMN